MQTYFTLGLIQTHAHTYTQFVKPSVSGVFEKNPGKLWLRKKLVKKKFGGGVGGG